MRLNCVIAIILLSDIAFAEWKISLSGGVSIQKAKSPNNEIYFSIKKYVSDLNDYWRYCTLITPDDLITPENITENITVETTKSDGTNILIGELQDPGIGFSTVTNHVRDFSTFNRKVKAYLDSCYKHIYSIFPASSGFYISGYPTISAINRKTTEGLTSYFGTINSTSVILRNKNYPSFATEILRGYPRNYTFSYGTITNSETLMKGITSIISPVESDIIQSWAAATNPVTTKKNGLTLGLSGAYSKALFPKTSSTFGLYTGVEGFAEINPNESKSNGFSIKEKSFGFRPFVGIIKKDNWTIYALGGVKCAKRDIKSDMFHVKKGKLSYEIGVGSDYILSDRFSISAKFIKGLTSKFNINGLSFQTSSTKILFSLNYHFK